MAIIDLSRHRPPDPQADFAFEIDFQRGTGSASRVFSATHDFIKACEALDAELVQLIDSSIQTVLVLEDIESGSIKTWLRSSLSAVDDDALKKLDWRTQVGAYLVKAKYAVVRWCDDENAAAQLPALRGEIQRIAAETDVRHLPAYSAPSVPALVAAARDFQAVKERLAPGDRAKLITNDGVVFEMNLSVRMPIEDIEALAIARTIEVPPHEMILPVKKPDYLGDSMWELRHGKRNVSARIEDEDWLRRFQTRQVDVRPGDSLLCRVSTQLLYGHDNELIAEQYTVSTVLDVLAAGGAHPELDLREPS